MSLHKRLLRHNWAYLTPPLLCGRSGSRCWARKSTAYCGRFCYITCRAQPLLMLCIKVGKVSGCAGKREQNIPALGSITSSRWVRHHATFDIKGEGVTSSPWFRALPGGWHVCVRRLPDASVQVNPGSPGLTDLDIILCKKSVFCSSSTTRKEWRPDSETPTPVCQVRHKI